MPTSKSGKIATSIFATFVHICAYMHTWHSHCFQIVKLNIHGMTYDRYRKIDLNIRSVAQINSVGFAHTSIHIAHAHTSSEPAVSLNGGSLPTVS